MIKLLGTPGEAIDIQTFPAAPHTSQKIDLVKTHDMELIQFLIPAGDGIPTYKAQGELILHCLQGRVVVSDCKNRHKLNSGQLLYFSTNEPFSIHAIEDTSLLATILTAKQGRSVETIGD